MQNITPFKTKIYYEDVDVGGYCYHSKYLNFCERARSEIFFSKSASPIQNGYHFVVKTLTANYKLPALFGDEIKVYTSIKEFRGASITMFQQILNQDEKIVFEMDIVLVGMLNSKVAKIPQEFKKILNITKR
ncbi:MAG: YbgC/FadM family acyl-CoA thioesterase [Campylobacterales bacterium]|nr:YbgC/FadM family acyl-CoA thioesterase [Campylobacterales bacterium]